MEQISDADRDFMVSYRLAALHSWLGPEEASHLLEAMVKALTAARIEGERHGLTKAKKIADESWGSREVSSTIADLIAELTP